MSLHLALRRSILPALLVGLLFAAGSVADSPLIPPGPQQIITPKIDVPTPTPAVIPTPDDLDAGLQISATLDGEPVDANPITMEPGQLLVLTLTGADLDKTPRNAAWTLNREAKGRIFHDATQRCLSFTATAQQADSYLFTAAVNGLGEDSRPDVVARWVVVSGKGPQPPPVVVPDEPDVPDPVKPTPDPSKITAVTYVYEKDEGEVPSGVRVALDKLSRNGILATAFEVDTTDGDGETPDQYKAQLAAQIKSGKRPALVVMTGATVKDVWHNIATEQDVLETVK